MLKITVDAETDRHAWTTIIPLADRFDLTTYDAAYLELSQCRSLPLASFDQPMPAAARTLGLAVIGD